MNKTFKVADAYTDNKEIKVYENDKCILNIILNEQT